MDTISPVKKTKEIKWSYSRLSCYDHCHFQYKLKYVDLHYPPFGNVATEFGTAVHKAEESIANCIKDNRAIDYVAIKNQFIIDCAKVAYKYTDWWQANKDSGKTYEEQKQYYLTYGVYRLEKFMQAHPSYIIVGAEVKIDYLYKNNHFTGSIDRLLFDKATSTYYIQDIKSWPIMEPKHTADKKLPTQLAIYSLALAEMKSWNLDAIKCQYDLPLVDGIFDAGESGFIQKTTQALDEWFAGIEAQNWKPTASALCAWCPFSATNPDSSADFKYLCPYHSVWDRELREKGTSNKMANSWQGIERHEAIMEAYTRKEVINNGC